MYGGTGDTDTFGGTYQQLEGNLIIGNATFGTPDATTGKVAAPESINSAVMGTDTTVYDIRTGSVTVTQDSTMKGASATFSGDSTLLLADGSTLDFGTPATFTDDSRVGIQVSDSDGQFRSDLPAEKGYGKRDGNAERHGYFRPSAERPVPDHHHGSRNG